MKNYVQEGCRVKLAAPYARLSGEGALVGSIFGVALKDLANAEEGEFQLEGVVELAKASGALTQGAKVYWDNSAKNLTSTSMSNTLVGVVIVAAGSSDTTVIVRLGIVA